MVMRWHELVAIGLECGLDMSDLSIFLLRFCDHAVRSVNECSYNRPFVLEMVVRVKVWLLKRYLVLEMVVRVIFNSDKVSISWTSYKLDNIPQNTHNRHPVGEDADRQVTSPYLN